MRIAVTGGGTGGHLFPGIALASGMQERIPDCQILFIGTSRHLDKKALAGYDFELATIQCMGLKGMGIKNRISSVLQLPSALLEARKIMAKFKPHLVFGVGGYVTGPVLLAARTKGIPVCIHEQNSVPGLANKIVSRIAHRIYLSMPCAYPFPEKKTVLTGNPVRREIIKAALSTRKKLKGKTTILILGGSQGAHRVNMLVLKAAELLPGMTGEQVEFIHQTGKNDMDNVKERYRELGIQAQVKDFFDDMASIYSQADLVISRAGATTLAELSVMGLPALLIPYPYAADNHQRTNGLYYQEGGAARMFLEHELSGPKLATEIVSCMEKPDHLAVMAENMRRMSRPDATGHIIDECLALMQKSGEVPV